jgi:hypothetical protein
MVYSAPDTSAAAGQVVIARFLVLHSILSLLVALIGALTFGWFASRGERSARRSGGTNP